MKLASYTVNGAPSYGIVLSSGVIDVPRVRPNLAPSIKGLLAAEGLQAIENLTERQPTFSFDEIVYAPPIPDASNIICVGLNYQAHAQEAGLAAPERYPKLFTRLNSTLVGHEQSLELPEVSHELDFEGELAVIIGRGGRHVQKAEALQHVAGYACFNDASVRDFQKHSAPAGKNFYRTGGFGPWMVTADEIADPGQLMLTTRLNGVEVQRAGTDKMIHTIPSIIAYWSIITPLQPGDVIVTGTPEGVGLLRTPPLWMKLNDVIEVEISGVGCLRNSVSAESPVD